LRETHRLRKLEEMGAGLDLVLGSLAGLLALFGAFVLLRARHGESVACPLDAGSRRAAWQLLVLGAAGFLLALLFGGLLAR
jgi:hypothetical protein